MTKGRIFGVTLGLTKRDSRVKRPACISIAFAGLMKFRSGARQ